MLTASMAAYIDAQALNVVFQRLYDANPSRFQWQTSGEIHGFSWTLDVSIPGPPTATFGPQSAPNANVGLTVDVAISAQVKPFPAIPIHLVLHGSASVSTRNGAIVLQDFGFNITPGERASCSRPRTQRVG